jgi:hypothetical protein
LEVAEVAKERIMFEKTIRAMLPTVQQTIAYLESKGWTQSDHKNNKYVSVFTSSPSVVDDSGNRIVFAFPKNDDLVDSQESVLLMLPLLASLEKCGDEEIVAKIKGEDKMFKEKALNLYKISRSGEADSGQYESAIVVAEDEQEAKDTHPSGVQSDWNDPAFLSWISPEEDIIVELVGTAEPHLHKGVLVASNVGDF